MKKAIFSIVILFYSINAISQVYLNEIFASNASVNLDTKYYNFSGWVEIYNDGQASVNLGNYYFSDDKNDKIKWKLPNNSLNSKQFAVFWFDEMNSENHTNFKLDAKGEVLFLFNSDGSIIDSVTYPKQYTNISFSRFPNGGSAWQYNMEPTLQLSNSSKIYSSFTSLPEFSQNGGFFNSTFELSITTNNSNAEIRYTLNGSDVKQNSIKYTSQINISRTTIVRAKVFETGHLPSETVTQSYVFPDHQIHLPAFSLITDSVNLWDNMLGIYITGSNGIAGYCSNDPRNYNQNWERPFNIEFFDSLGIQKLNQYAGIKIAGHCSRGFNQKSFSIIPRKLYGKSKLKYPFFSDKNIIEFDRIFLRNSGNDWASAFLRDALFNSLVKGKMDIDYNAYQPSVVFLNGNYWGLLDIREKIDEHFIMSNYNISDNQFDMLENDRFVINGNADNYTNLINFISNNNLANGANYEKVKSQIDVNEYINYMITQIYIGNTDWPGNNIKYWRSKSGGGKWRWILTDLDFGFGMYDPNINHNTLQFALETNGPDWPNPPWSTLLFRKLIGNADFLKDFVTRFANYLNTVFEPNNVIHVIDSLQNNISYEMYYHNRKWQSIDDWNRNVEFLRTFSKLRPEYVRQHINSTLRMNGTYKLTLKSNLPAAGQFLIDNFPIRGEIFQGIYFKNYSVNINALAKEGYKFIGWYKLTYSTDSTFLINKGEEWKYSDGESIPGVNWFAPDFDDNGWKTGNAQFGYGDGDEITILDQGIDPNNKKISSYFRKTFNLNNVASYSGLKLKLLIDDGAVIFINNTEVLRYRMPDGIINYSTLANYSAGGIDENTFFGFDVPSGVLKEGINTIAVEVHQNSSSSSDVSFDLQLTAAQIQNMKEDLIPGQNIDLSNSGDVEILAKYKSLENQPDIYINEIVADNENGAIDESGSHTPWIELFNATNTSIDIAGFYISNDKNNLNLWQIPNSDASKTTIEPDSFLILWADAQTIEGPSHLPFSLNQAGGQIFLSKMTGTEITLLDSLTYLTQLSNVALGRYTDGTLGTYFLSSPTPLKSNAAPNQLPKFTSSPVLNANEQAPYSYSITASDFENDNLKFEYDNLPSWLNLTDNKDGTANLTGTPLNNNKGENPVTIFVVDGKSILKTDQTFNILVQGPLGFYEQHNYKWAFYPNPVKDFVNIIPDSRVKTYDIRITDISGKLIEEKSRISGNYRLNLSTYLNGIYFLITRINQNTFITKLIKTE